MFKIAVLISGGGTDMQSVIDGIKSGYINDCKIVAVLSDNPKAYGLERAKNQNIDTYVLDRKSETETVSEQIFRILDNEKVDLIVLAGFLSILSGEIIKVYQNKIVNIHPSLIPSFCGHGMYGMNVHKKAIDYGVKVSGCTVHFVDSGTDTGPIILQKAVPVYDHDTPEDLQKRILIEEHKALPEAIKYLSEGRIKVSGRKVKILEELK